MAVPKLTFIQRPGDGNTPQLSLFGLKALIEEMESQGVSSRALLRGPPGSAVLIVACASASFYAAEIALALGASKVDYLGGGAREKEIAARLGANVIDGPCQNVSDAIPSP